MQSTVDAKKQSYENPNSSVAAETIRLLVKRSYDDQMMHRSPNTVTEKLSNKTTNAAIKSKFLEKLDHVNIAFYKVEVPKAQVAHKKPIFVAFFILQYTKLRML